MPLNCACPTGPPNFIEMIDNLLDKVDPAQFVVMVEKLGDALPPPGQAILGPFLVVLKQVRRRLDAIGQAVLFSVV